MYLKAPEADELSCIERCKFNRVNLLHPLNELAEIIKGCEFLIVSSPRFTRLTPLQFANADEPIVTTDEGMETSTSCIQSEKAPLPMFSSTLFIITELSPVQPLKLSGPMDCRFAGSRSSERDVQFMKD